MLGRSNIVCEGLRLEWTADLRRDRQADRFGFDSMIAMHADLLDRRLGMCQLDREQTDGNGEAQALHTRSLRRCLASLS
jgi:hypothetical protein